MKIEMNKKYRTVKDHHPVRILCVDRIDPWGNFTVVTAVKLQDHPVEQIILYTAQGVGLGNLTPAIEEVPPVDWSRVAVDTPIWVNKTAKRHFAKYGDGYVQYFPDGRTSHTWDRIEGVKVSANAVSLEAPNV